MTQLVWKNRIAGYSEEPVDQLLAHPGNWRIHPKLQQDALSGILHDIGLVQNVICNVRTQHVVDGHLRISLALREGQPTVPVTWIDVSEAEEARLLLALDTISAMAATDAAQLAALLREVSTSSAAEQQMLDELAAKAGVVPGLPAAGAGGDDFDTTPEDGPTRVQRGDLWLLRSPDGREHRLLVGDCTDPANVVRLMGGEKPRLMVTDPPYGVVYNPEWRKEAGISNSTGMMGKVPNDDRIDWTDAYRLCNPQIAYVWHAGRHAREVAQHLDDAGFDIIAQIIWAKDRFALSRGDYHWQHEPCWYAVQRGLPHNWQGARDQSTLWTIKRLSSNSHDSPEAVWGHGTQKPMECMERPIRNNTAQDDLIVDPFLGSGTTLIAAHRTGRRCYGMELSERYSDVVLRRAEAEGLTVERVAP